MRWRGEAKAECPVVVIGAGLGGLCSAAYLARAGLPVTVVEQRPAVGGYASSFRRGRFTFEVSLHGSALRGRAVQKILTDLGVADRLELAPLPEFYRLLGGAVDLVVPQCDPDAYVALLSDHFPEEATGIRRFVTIMLEIIEETNRLQENWDKLFKPLFPFRFPQLWRWRRATLAELIESCVSDLRLIHLLGGLWSYFGLPPARLSAFYFAVATGEYLKYGSYYIRPRSQQLSQLLKEALEAAGGRVVTNVSATHIHLATERVTAVSLSDKRRLPAQAVIANISPQVLTERLLPNHLVRRRHFRRYRHHRPSMSAFIVWLGLGQPLPHGLEGAEFHVNHPAGPDAEFDAARKGDVQRGAFSVTLYDNILSDYSLPGTATLSIFFLCAYAPWRRYAADYLLGKKTAYQEEKRRWAAVLIQRAEQWVLPGLAGMIEELVTATPLTCERFTGNPEGAIYGYEQGIESAFNARLPNRSPVGGLYLTGAWSFPGGGFGGVLRSAEAAAQALLADTGLA
ncbi:MAG: NAD(P)/FAD-dependent oxidoreductase [Desulfosarcinaceae bacterium]|nr:NAD(P)/FAD-dependent oxidoreductase [Desulfosarcinaceae bacterium]